MSLPRFYGTYRFHIDDKTRIQVPSLFRKLMLTDDPRMLVMTKGPDKCIYAFPQDNWEYYMDQMLELDIPDKELLKLTRSVLAPAINCSIDSQWRVKLPGDLITYAALEDEIEIVGQIDKIEIWNPEIRQAYLSTEEMKYDDLVLPLFMGKMRRQKAQPPTSDTDSDA